MLRLVALALVAAALAPLPVPPAAAGVDDPWAGAPPEDVCYRLSPDEVQAMTNDSEPTRCGQLHTTRTVAVFQLPAALDWSSPSEKISVALLRKCDAGRDAVLGSKDGKRARTGIRMTFFTPTEEQRDLGARWVRCDVYLPRTSGVATLPDRTPPYIRHRHVPYDVLACYIRNGALTTCRHRHAFRTTGSFEAPRGRYPSQRRIEKIVVEGCVAERRVSSREWRFTAPTEMEWRSGDRWFTCISRSIH